jgi:hypothetical protein
MMAIIRTVLARKGFIQSQHGLNGYEADDDANMLLADSNVAFVSDLPSNGPAPGDLSLSGLTTGALLSTAPTLAPQISALTLYANGQRYSNPEEQTLPAAPPNTTSHLFYTTIAPRGWYYQPTPTPTHAGDAYAGSVTTNATAVTTTTPATLTYGRVHITAPSAGNFTWPHRLGRTPNGALLRPTSAPAIWWQAPTDRDAQYLYLTAAAEGATATVQVW